MILLTCLFYLGLARLGGGHDSCSGLCDAAGRVLQAVQLGAVFVCFHLERKSSKHQTTEAIQSFAVILPFFLCIERKHASLVSSLHLYGGKTWRTEAAKMYTQGALIQFFMLVFTF